MACCLQDRDEHKQVTTPTTQSKINKRKLKAKTQCGLSQCFTEQNVTHSNGKNKKTNTSCYYTIAINSTISGNSRFSSQ